MCFFSSPPSHPLVSFDLLGYLHQGSRCLLFFGQHWGERPAFLLCSLFSVLLFFILVFFFFFFNKLPLNKLENTHPGVIRRPQTPVICLLALPGKREQGRGRRRRERRTARISSSSSSSPPASPSSSSFPFLPLAWYSVRGEREEEQTTEGD